METLSYKALIPCWPVSEKFRKTALCWKPNSRRRGGGGGEGVLIYLHDLNAHLGLKFHYPKK